MYLIEFDVQERPDGIGRLPVGEALGKLHHQDQREPPRRQCRLPGMRKERGKVRIRKDRPQLITQRDPRTVGKGFARRPRRCCWNFGFCHFGYRH